MRSNVTLLHCIMFLPACMNENDKPIATTQSFSPQTVRDIHLPAGFQFFKGDDEKFSDWLLSIKLKKDNTVYLFNGERKRNQRAQYAVLDIQIGTKDLVQCADVLMKLRAEYLFANGDHSSIAFTATSGDKISYQQWLKGIRWRLSRNKLVPVQTNIKHNPFSAFMDLVYSYCGTYSLSKQMHAVQDEQSIQPGDAFVQGGFPGHAVLIMAVAKDHSGKKVFMLAQGYMPAQDIHILRNPSDPAGGPWFHADQIETVITPEWTFQRTHLKRW